MSIGLGWGSTNYGVLTWQPTGAVTGHTVTVTITDQTQTTSVQAVFAISTSSAAAHFVFLDALNGSDSAAGTFSAPWQTLQKAFGSTYSATGAGAGAICYAKATGTYSSASLLYTGNDVNSSWALFEMHSTRKPIALIGLGGQATIDWTSGVWGLTIGGSSSADFFLATLNPDGFGASVPNQKWVLFADTGAQLRFTTFNVTWTNSGYGSTGNSVPSPHTGLEIGTNVWRSYIAMVGFSEPNRTSGAPGNNYAGHCLYDSEFWVSDGFTINTPSSNYDAMCYAKGTNQHFEMRNHFLSAANSGVGATCTVAGFDSDAGLPTDGEVRYCYMGQAPLNTNCKIGTQSGSYGTFYMNRNTLIGQFENAFGGVGNYVNNVVQTTGTPIPSTGGGTASGNVTATSGIINSSTLLLEGSALSSVGIAGAQIA
jgi:hypothetical protein